VISLTLGLIALVILPNISSGSALPELVLNLSRHSSVLHHTLHPRRSRFHSGHDAANLFDHDRRGYHKAVLEA
jgi:hypothetical protein